MLRWEILNTSFGLVYRRPLSRRISQRTDYPGGYRVPREPKTEKDFMVELVNYTIRAVKGQHAIYPRAYLSSPRKITTFKVREESATASTKLDVVCDNVLYRINVPLDTYAMICLDHNKALVVNYDWSRANDKTY